MRYETRAGVTDEEKTQQNTRTTYFSLSSFKRTDFSLLFVSQKTHLNGLGVICFKKSGV